MRFLEVQADELFKILHRSRWMRFSVSYFREQWTAVIAHERGRIYGKATKKSATDAIWAAILEARKNVNHLKVVK